MHYNRKFKPEKEIGQENINDKMNLHELVNTCKFEIITDIYRPDAEVTGGYSGDLLSDVIANTKNGNVWITMQTHLNITAIAALKELSAIIIVMNKNIEQDVIDKAKEEKITMLRTGKTAFQVSGIIYKLGVM